MTSLLAQARDAYARCRWQTAYEGFRGVGASAELDDADLAAFADAAWWLGHTDESLALSEQGYRRHRHDGHVGRAARLAIEIGVLWLVRGEPTVGSGWIARARRLLADEPDCAEHGYLLYLEAEEAMEADELAAAVALTHRIQRLADRHDEPTLCAIGLVLEGTAMVRQGHVDTGLTRLDEAMLPVRAGEVTPAWAGNLYCHLMSLFIELADIRRARDWTDATERWCDRHGNPAMFRGVCRVHRAQLLRLEGAWADAERQAAQACRDLADMNVAVVAEGEYVLGELRRLRADHDGAEAAYARAHELGRDPQPGLALLRLAQGRDEAAAAALHTALAAVEPSPARAPLLAAQAEVAAATGAPDLARAAAEELTAIAAMFGTAGLTAAARQAAGTARRVADEPERALPLLRDAHRRWHELDARYDAARVRGELARALAAAGDPDAAARELRAAAAVFRSLGAAHDLRALARDEPVAGLPGGLTSREGEVLACVAAGHTNRRIATQLTISERTVERHLSNIFTKLGVASRTEAAAFAFAHGLAPAPGR